MSPRYGALALVLFEVSNLNAAPHLLMTQLDYRGTAHFLNGIAFLITCVLPPRLPRSSVAPAQLSLRPRSPSLLRYTGSRIIGCTILGAVYLREYVCLNDTRGLDAIASSTHHLDARVYPDNHTMVGTSCSTRPTRRCGRRSHVA